MKKKQRRILLDADYLIYYTSFRFEEIIYWGDSLVTLAMDYAGAKLFIDELIKTYMADVEADHLTVAISCPREKCFRQRIYDHYKGHRDSQLRPIGYHPIRKFLKEKYNALEYDGLEADDIVTILASRPSEEERVIVSPDKDMMTTPFLVYDPNHPELGILSRTVEEGYFNFMVQVLQGDSADGYKGCPKFGPVSSVKYLSKLKPEEYWEAVVAAYEKNGLKREDALRNARLAHLLRDKDYVKGEDVQPVTEERIKELLKDGT